jgi:hypothetical protein
MPAVPGLVEFALIAVPAALAIAALEGRASVDDDEAFAIPLSTAEKCGFAPKNCSRDYQKTI